MYRDRFWVSLGRGEALNEHITGAAWPIKSERNARLKECVDVMRRVWAGELVDLHGRVTVENAQLYTLPKRPPAVMGAAISPETARWMGEWADGLMTVAAPRETMRAAVDAFRKGEGTGKPMYVRAKISYADDEAAAREGAHDQWKTNVLSSKLLADLPMPSHFSDASRFVRPEDLDSSIRISSDIGRHIDWIRKDIEMGFEHVYLHNLNRSQERFIEVFGDQVLPALG